MSDSGELAREPSLQDTEFSITDPDLRVRLEEKLREYTQRNERNHLTGLDQEVFAALQGRPADLLAVFKELILGRALEISDTRDTATRPITIIEIALLVQDETQLPVVGAAAVPYATKGFYDVPHVSQNPNDYPNDTAHEFAKAYQIVQFYANGDGTLLQGGTGLPEVPTPPGA